MGEYDCLVSKPLGMLHYLRQMHMAMLSSMINIDLVIKEGCLSYKNLCSQGIRIPWIKNKIRCCVSCKGHFWVQYGICNLSA